MQIKCDEYGENGSEGSFLHVDYRVECGTPAHTEIRNWGAFLIAVWPVGLLLVIVALLYAYKV